MTVVDRARAVNEPAPRPLALEVRPEGIPGVLRSLPQWLVWRNVWDPNKKDKRTGLKGAWDKPPFDARTGRRASSTDPDSWCDFDTALAAYRDPTNRWDGIGFVPVPENGLTLIDLDNCRDPVAGRIKRWATPVLRTMDTYMELSPSGTGMRIVARGGKPDNNRSKNGDVEMYDGRTKDGKPGGRYLTITGHRLPNAPREVRKRWAAIANAYAEHLNPAGGHEAVGSEPPAGDLTAVQPAADDDDELMAVMFGAANGAEVKALFDGDRSGYPSPSEADLALCSHLAFYFRTPERIDAVFRRSGLYRAKWDRDDYRDCTIAKALEGRTEFYVPDRAAAMTDADRRFIKSLQKAARGGKVKAKAPTVAEVLLAIGRRADLFHTRDKVGHATVGRVTYKVDSQAFRHHLVSAYMEETDGKVPNLAAQSTAVGALEAVAIHQRSEHQVFVRIAGDDGKVYLDLADADSTVIEIDADGWRVTGREATVLTIPQTPSDAAIESGIYVLTQERLQILLELAPDIKFSLVVVDEAQTLAGDSRGIILQTVIDHLRQMDTETQFLFSTPPTTNPQIFEGLFGLAGETPIEEEESPVAQNLVFLDTDATILDLVHIQAQIGGQREAIGSTRIGAELLQPGQTLATLGWHFGRDDQNLVYVGSQAASEEVASMISQLRLPATETLSDEVRSELEDLASFLRDHVHRQYLLAETVQNGVAFHYGQMPSVVRQAIEEYFDEGLLRYLVSTSTLLHGVNLPAKNLFLLDPTKGGEWPNQNADAITGPEFWNLAGRAGRLGKEFEGNVFIINQKRWRANPVDDTRKQPIKAALDEHVKDKKAELIGFIANTGHASGDEQGLESAFVRLFNESRRGTLDQTLARICGPDTTSAAELKTAVEAVVPSIRLPAEITERHITVSVFRQQEMYDYLTKKIQTNGAPDYIPPHPQSDWNSAHPKMIRLLKRVHNQFQHLPTKDGSHKYFAPLALRWMRGDPLPELISGAYEWRKKNQKKEPNIATVIRNIMGDIENELRFRYVKFLGCYTDILRLVLTETGNQQNLESIPSIPLYLELGASSKTMVSLISIGLTRTTAGIIAKKAANQGMGTTEVEDWLLKFNLEAAGVPGICIREVEKLWRKK